MLLSQSLFIDHEYRADCLYKINYINYINNESDSILTKEKYMRSELPDKSIYTNRVKKITNNVNKVIKEY